MEPQAGKYVAHRSRSSLKNMKTLYYLFAYLCTSSMYECTLVYAVVLFAFSCLVHALYISSWLVIKYLFFYYNSAFDL
jgi:hypothetical protein